MRAIAVLTVFFAHLCWSLVKFGFIPAEHPETWDLLLNQIGHIGVLFFFVHTALVLMFSLDRTRAEGLFLNFYLRRIFRIYPLSIACILGILVLKVPQVPYVTYAAWDRSEIFSNLLLVQNIFRKPDMIMPLWTLPREFQMYLALPFLYVLLKRIPSARTVLVVWFAFFAAVPSTPLLSCFPCFMGGVLAYQLGKERVFRLRSYVWPATIFGLAAVNLALSLTILPDYRADYILCMLLGLMVPNVMELKESWITSASKYVAQYSYGVYLCHDPVIWFAFEKLKFLPIFARWAALILLMISIPWAARNFLEAPMIRIGRDLANRWSSAWTRFSRSIFKEAAPGLAE